jgi:hypothetical protein
LILEKENIKTDLCKNTNKTKKRKYNDEFILKIKEMTIQGKSISYICKELNLSKGKVSYLKFRYLKNIKNILI